MKKQSLHLLYLLRVFQSASAFMLRLFFFLVVLGGILLGFWATGLIGRGGRDTIDPQRTVRLDQSSVSILQSFLDDREDRIEAISVERYSDPFR